MSRKTINDRNTRMLKASRDGMDPREIADQFGLSPSHVYRTLKVLGAPVAGMSSAEILQQSARGDTFSARKEPSRSAVVDSARKDIFGAWKPEEEMARNGLRRFGGQVDEDYDRVFRQGLDRRIRVFREMGDEPVIASTLSATRMPLRRLSWRVETDGKSRDDKKAVEFVESAMNDMSTSWPSVIDQALSMLQYGFSLSELVYKKRNGTKGDVRSKYKDGRIGWRKWVHLAPDSLAPGNEWVFDEKGGVQGVVQAAAPEYKNVPISIEKMLLFRTTDFKGNPEGQSLLRAMYIPWYFKRNLEEIEAISAERSGAGFPVIYLGNDVRKSETADSDIGYYREIGRNIRVDEQMSVVIPHAKMGGGAKEGDGVLFELVRPSGTTMNFNEMIVRYEQRMAMVGLGQFLMLGMNKIGTQALASEQTDFFELALEGWIEKIADVINRYAVERLIDLNHFPGLTAYPRLRPEPVVRANIETFATAVNALASAQLITPGPDLEKYIRGLFDLPEIDPEILAAKEKQALDAAIHPPVPPGMPGGPAIPGSTDDDGDGPGDSDRPDANGGQGDNAPDPERDSETSREDSEIEEATAPRTLSEIFVAAPSDERPAWIGFYLNAAVSAELALVGGEPADTLHVTLVMLDRDDVLTPERIDRLGVIVEAFAALESPVKGRVTGPAVFNGNGVTRPLVALVDAPSLSEWRNRLVHVLEHDGYSLDRRHGFIPHITLAYLPAEIPSVDVAMAMSSVKAMDVAFDRVRLSKDGIDTEYDLKGLLGVYSAESNADPKAEAADGEVETFAALTASEIEALDAVEEYEREIELAYIEEAEKIASGLNRAKDEDARRLVLAAGLAALLIRLRNIGRVNLQKALALGLGDMQPGPDLIRDLADAIRENENYLANFVGVDLKRKVEKAIEDEDTMAALGTDVAKASLMAAMMTSLARAVSYGGAFWSLNQYAKASKAQLLGGRIYWRLEPGADHCQTCLTYGNTWYDDMDDLLEKTGGVWPANGTDCSQHCRCSIRMELLRAKPLNAAEIAQVFKPGAFSEATFMAFVDAFHGTHDQRKHGYRFGGGYAAIRGRAQKYKPDGLWDDYKKRWKAKKEAAGGGGASKGDDPSVVADEAQKGGVPAKTKEAMVEADQGVDSTADFKGGALGEHIQATDTQNGGKTLQGKGFVNEEENIGILATTDANGEKVWKVVDMDNAEVIGTHPTKEAAMKNAKNDLAAQQAEIQKSIVDTKTELANKKAADIKSFEDSEKQDVEITTLMGAKMTAKGVVSEDGATAVTYNEKTGQYHLIEISNGKTISKHSDSKDAAKAGQTFSESFRSVEAPASGHQMYAGQPNVTVADNMFSKIAAANMGKLSSQQEGAIRQYQDGDSKEINAHLWTEGNSGFDHTKTVKNIDAAMKKTGGLPEDTLLYRGQPEGSPLYNLAQGLKVGETYTSKGYDSTTIHPKVTSTFGQGVTVTYRAPKGTPGIYMNARKGSAYRSEYEFLTARDQSWTVVGKKVYPGGRIEMVVEYAGGNE